MRKWTAYLIAFAILVGMPFLGLYYVHKGVRYRKDLFAQMKDYGAVAPFGLGDSTSAGRVVVVFFRQGAPVTDSIIASVHRQFDGRQDVLFFTDVPADVAMDSLQIAPLPPDRAAMLRAKVPGKDLHAAAALIDPDGHLRRFYDLTREDEVHLLVRQTGLFLAPRKRALSPQSPSQ